MGDPPINEYPCPLRRLLFPGSSSPRHSVAACTYDLTLLGTAAAPLSSMCCIAL